MAKLRGGIATGPLASPLDIQSERFLGLVLEVCEEENVTPPGHIRLVELSRAHRSNASAVRVGKLGRGYVTATYALVEDLTDDELRLVVRHELGHYRYAEARWAPLQGTAFISPVLVYAYGYPLNHLVGLTALMIMYFLAVVAHVLAFKSKRFFEGRADRESIRHQADGHHAQQALLKVATLKQRYQQNVSPEEGERIIKEFRVEVEKPQTKTTVLYNMIWGTHPLLDERLATFENIARRCPD